MKMNLGALNDYLFEALDTITNSDLHGEELKDELNRSENICKLANTIIDNGKLALETVKQLNEYGYKNVPVPDMLTEGVNE